MRTARALNPNASHAAEDFPMQVRDLQAWTSRRYARRHHRASARAARARDLDPRQLRLRRAARGALRPAVCLRLLLHRRPGRRAGDGALSRLLPAERAPSRAAGDALRLGARRRQRRGGGAPRAVARSLAHRSRSAARSGRCSRPTRSPRAASTPAEEATLAPMRAQGLRRLGRRPSRDRSCAAWPTTSRSTRSSINTWAHDPAVRRTLLRAAGREFALTAPAGVARQPAVGEAAPHGIRPARSESGRATRR